jgi:3',5'-cyclic AMP phosphodiesterase CpdA
VRTRRLALLALGPVLALAPAGCGIGDGGRAAPQVPGSTLRATVVDRDGDGALERGPGERAADRTELAPRRPAGLREVARVAQLTDTHVRDEESPARVPFLDRLGPPVTSAFRPQEALSAQVLTAAVRAVAAERPQAVLVTGDLIDSAQRNELELLLSVLEGGRVEPDSGRPGYRGVQGAANADGSFYRPDVDAPRLPGLLVRAQREFVAPGVRTPWYAALGNHDLLVQGELAPSPRTDAVATGDEALLTYDPALEDLLRRAGGAGAAAGEGTPDLRGVPPAAIDALLARGVPGRTARVAADPARRHLRPAEAIARLQAAGALPRSVAPGGRADFAVDLSPALRAIVLDTVDRAGGRGVLAPASVAFLRRALAAAPADRSLLVVSHHGLERAAGGEAALALLDADPRVVAELSGDTHRHAIEPRRTPAGGFWRISTASLADWPQQGRMLRLLRGPGGTRALETWVVDHDGGTDAQDLAGAARTLSFLDAQGGRPDGLAGARSDRNARLWLPPLRP